MLDGDSPPKEEFVVEENVNYKKLTSEGAVTADNDAVTVNNLPPPPEDTKHLDTLRQATLTFDPSPPLEEAMEYSTKAPDNQAKLRHWHYHLGHLAFKELQQLAHHGKIPKRLANVRSPRCTSCLFGAITMVPLRGKERKNKHTVFTATKPAECVSVNHLQSMEPSFFSQERGTYQDPLQECQNFCRPLFKSPIHLTHDQQSRLIGDNQCQASI